MFCPNCEKDAGSANFCPHCGFDLRKTDGEELKVPVGKYQGTLGYIILDENAVTIHKKILFKTVERKIPYDQVAKVAFGESGKSGGGFLCIRSADERNIPLVDKKDAAVDETTVGFIYTANDAMRMVAEFLQKVAAGNAGRFEEPTVKVSIATEVAEEIPKAVDASAVDLEPYFRDYAPNRLSAIKALMYDTGMDMRQAKDLIDRFFDEKQREIYASDPSAAMRDLKRALNPKKAAFQEQKEALDSTGRAYCPKCLSTSITANQKGFGFVKGALGASVGLDVGLIAGGIGSKKMICTCLKCGYQWKLGKNK